MARTVHEMESLVLSPQLAAISWVAAELPGLRRLGAQLRSSAQERLLVSLNEQNQATVGDCLQVFYNLRSLGEVVLLAVDETVKATAEVSAVRTTAANATTTTTTTSGRICCIGVRA
jgi:hypothetical protein